MLKTRGLQESAQNESIRLPLCLGIPLEFAGAWRESLAPKEFRQWDPRLALDARHSARVVLVNRLAFHEWFPRS